MRCRRVDECMSMNVATIDLESTVEEACKIMGEKHIGSLVVIREGKPYGLFTERDLLSKIILKGFDIKNVKVKDFTSAPIVTINPDTSIREAARIMCEMHIRRLPVIDSKGILAGIFTSADLAGAFTGH